MDVNKKDALIAVAVVVVLGLVVAFLRGHSATAQAAAGSSTGAAALSGGYQTASTVYIPTSSYDINYNTQMTTNNTTNNTTTNNTTSQVVAPPQTQTAPVVVVGNPTPPPAPAPYHAPAPTPAPQDNSSDSGSDYTPPPHTVTVTPAPSVPNNPAWQQAPSAPPNASGTSSNNNTTANIPTSSVPSYLQGMTTDQLQARLAGDQSTWGYAPPDEQDRIHQDATYIQSLLHPGATYDATSGTWSA